MHVQWDIKLYSHYAKLIREVIGGGAYWAGWAVDCPLSGPNGHWASHIVCLTTFCCSKIKKEHKLQVFMKRDLLQLYHQQRAKCVVSRCILRPENAQNAFVAGAPPQIL